jgi:Cu/Ag efflux pump CusA
VVRLEEGSRSKIEEIENVLIDTEDGQKVPLHYVADVVSTSGPNTINRENVAQENGCICQRGRPGPKKCGR